MCFGDPLIQVPFLEIEGTLHSFFEIREDPRSTLWVDFMDHDLLMIVESSHPDPSNVGSNFKTKL